MLVIMVVLLLANLGVMAYFIANKTEKKRANNGPQWKNAIAHYLKTDIGFDTVQLQQYESLKTEHRKKLDTLFDQLKAEKDRRLRVLAEKGYSDSAIIRAANVSAEKQRMLDLQMLRHLKDIRNLCTPGQQQKYDTSIYKVMARKGGEKKKPKKE